MTGCPVEELAGGGVSGVAADGERTLSGGGEHLFEAEDLRGFALEAEPAEAGEGEDGRVVVAVADLADAGLDVAADGTDLEVGANLAELCFAAGRAGAADGAGREAVEGGAGAGDEDVAGVFAEGERGDDEAFRAPGGDGDRPCGLT
jgi:hypothetical protein